MEQTRSVSFESEEYEQDKDLLIRDAIVEVQATDTGHFVNLVTPECFGDPTDYLEPILNASFKDTITMRLIDQCGCGGYVLRVWKS